MSDNIIINDKTEFETTAETFLDNIFKPVPENNLGDIEVRTFPNGQWPEQYFCKTTKEASEIELIYVTPEWMFISVSIPGPVEQAKKKMSIMSQRFMRKSTMAMTVIKRNRTMKPTMKPLKQ